MTALLWRRGEDVFQPQRHAIWLLLLATVMALLLQIHTAFWLYFGTELVVLCAIMLLVTLLTAQSKKVIITQLQSWVLLISSLLMLIGLLLVIGQPDLLTISLASGANFVILGIGIKIAILSQHAWRLAAIGTLTAARISIFLGVLLPIVLLIALAQWLDDGVMPLLTLLGIPLLTTGFLLTRTYQNILQLLIVTSLIQLGLFALIIAIANTNGLALFWASHQALIIITLFGLTFHWQNTTGYRTQIKYHTPLATAVFILLLLSLLGIPPLPGFWLQLWLVFSIAHQANGVQLTMLITILIAILGIAFVWIYYVCSLFKSRKHAYLTKNKNKLTYTHHANKNDLIQLWQATQFSHWLDISFASVIATLFVLLPIGMLWYLISINGHLININTWDYLIELLTISRWQSFNPLNALLITGCLTIGLAIFVGRWRWSLKVLVFGYAMQFWFLTQTGILSRETIEAIWTVNLPIPLPINESFFTWRYDGLAWLFALLIIGTGFICAWILAADSYWQNSKTSQTIHGIVVALAVHVTAILFLIGSHNWLTFFLSWELVSWSAWFMTFNSKNITWLWSIRQLFPMLTSSLILLVAIAFWLATTGSLDLPSHYTALTNLTAVQITSLVILFGSAFTLRMGLIPWAHWQIPVHRYTDAPTVIVLTTVTARLGLFGIVIAILVPFSYEKLLSISWLFTWLNLHNLLVSSATLTIGIATLVAFRQRDVWAACAWLGIAQAGYLLLGLLTNSRVGNTGSLLHLFADALALSLLWLAVMAITRQSGATSWQQFGGLAKQMPFTAAVILISAASLIGLPSTVGFISKWFIYQALFTNGWIISGLIAILGSLATGLVLYRIIIRLWQAPIETPPLVVRELPHSLLAPLLGLATLILFAGIFPDAALHWVAIAQQRLN
ncbi:proton-conducting transporter membrane subunit [Thiospirillum jenense]|uniref:NADH:quinone oxidoreductase/Mrp antiporter transmembrane domain-containing protein n=1 Tax=Thiospirillum jenense TaxID=1653858 RepID=A0A839HF12_9GAMM|nr:proton-conducting transporter membrane subunit [Thiospirillum jenense]MBB1125012.1 hypothetical protein [Thiospirillum jenense]